jgi:protein TonB
MKKNSVFWGMLGFSAALHGLVIIGAGTGFHAPFPISENRFVSTLKMIHVGLSPPANDPEQVQEKEIVEKPAEPRPELPPIQETANEEMRDDAQERDSGNDKELQEDGTEKGAAFTDREYEALLAYIKNFISKNLVYPPMARQRNIQGVVSVYFEMEKNGEFVSVSVSRSSGSSILDNAAVSLIKKIHPLENLALNRTLTLNVNIAYELTE